MVQYRKSKKVGPVRFTASKRGMIVAVVAGTVTLGLAAAGQAEAQVFSKQIDQATFAGQWPVTATSGVLACDTSKAKAVTFTPTGSSTTYAVNGPALDWGKSLGWPDAKQIWNGANWGDFIDTGLKMCGS
jgi:hypothetical protein